MKEDEIKIVFAKNEDIVEVFELANEDDVRFNSFDKGKIEFEKHKHWYRNKLSDNKCLFLLAKYKNIFAGQVRFDIDVSDALIGISVKKEFRGKGIGKELITRGIEILYEKYSNIKKVVAQVKQENSSSIKLFEKCEFKFHRKIIKNGSNAIELIRIKD